MKYDCVWKVLIIPSFFYEALCNPHLGIFDVSVFMSYIFELMKQAPLPCTHITPWSRKQVTTVLGELLGQKYNPPFDNNLQQNR